VRSPSLSSARLSTMKFCLFDDLGFGCEEAGPQTAAEQYWNKGVLGLKEDGLKVRTSIASDSGRTILEQRGPRPQGGRSEGKLDIDSLLVEHYLNIGGLRLKEDGLKVRTSIASASGRTVPEHRGPRPQGGRSEGKNKHCFSQW
jgi:hypothetical protein